MTREELIEKISELKHEVADAFRDASCIPSEWQYFEGLAERLDTEKKELEKVLASME